MSVIIQFTPNVTPPPPVAPDESLTTTEGTPVSVTPVITQGGTPVTPNSLAIVSQPLHGTASVDGVSLAYTPSHGYFGTDVFTYDATVGGTASNVATIDIVIQRLVLSPSVRQQTTHRINRDVDSPVACCVRGEAGRMDLSKADIYVIVRPYGKRNTLVTLEASGDANGTIKFTVPADTFAAGGPGFDYGYGLRYQPRNLARFDVIASGALVYQAIMEIA